MFYPNYQSPAQKEPNQSKNSGKRMPFKQNEDEKLRELVNQYGELNWNAVAAQMPNRTVRQCRERWQNNLASNVTKKKWTSAEDDLLKLKYSEFGPRWKFLEAFFPGRTSYNIRNRWICMVRLHNLYSQPQIMGNEDKGDAHSLIVPTVMKMKSFPIPIIQKENDTHLQNELEIDFGDISDEPMLVFDDLFFEQGIMNHVYTD